MAMLDCRLRLPCLAKALRFSRFASPPRGYAAPGVEFAAEGEMVAKWGNWHCGENKERFAGVWVGREATLIEPFLPGEAVRVIGIGSEYWQVRMGGAGWKKSVHGDGAAIVEADPELVEDTKAIRAGFGLDLIANDYVVGTDGRKHLLEVNHIPSVTCFPEFWAAYRDAVVGWLAKGTEGDRR